MRSELVFAARQSIANRYTLCQATAKATRIFHVANTRIQDTTNGVLQRFASQQPLALRLANDLKQGRRGQSGSSRRPRQEVVA